MPNSPTTPLLKVGKLYSVMYRRHGFEKGAVILPGEIVMFLGNKPNDHFYSPEYVVRLLCHDSKVWSFPINVDHFFEVFQPVKTTP